MSLRLGEQRLQRRNTSSRFSVSRKPLSFFLEPQEFHASLKLERPPSRSTPEGKFTDTPRVVGGSVHLYPEAAGRCFDSASMFDRSPNRAGASQRTVESWQRTRSRRPETRGGQVRARPSYILFFPAASFSSPPSYSRQSRENKQKETRRAEESRKKRRTQLPRSKRSLP